MARRGATVKRRYDLPRVTGDARGGSHSTNDNRRLDRAHGDGATGANSGARAENALRGTARRGRDGRARRGHRVGHHAGANGTVTVPRWCNRRVVGRAGVERNAEAAPADGILLNHTSERARSGRG